MDKGSQATRKYDLAFNSWDSREYQAVIDVLERGNFTMGQEVSAFEDEFSAFLGVKESVMVNSGSSANLLIFHALALRYPEKVGGTFIVPAVSWSTTFFPISQAGFKLKFVDIDLQTLNLSYEALVRCCTEDVVGICYVSLLGNPSGLNRARDFASEHNLLFVEDNCESFGASESGIFAGTRGIMSSHSFYFSHHLQTMEGGMVSTNDSSLASIIRSIRAHGWTRDNKSGCLSSLDADDFQRNFEFVLPGFCVRPLEISGAVGRVQLQRWPTFFMQRCNNAKKFLELIAEYNRYLVPQSTNGSQSSWFGFSLLLVNDAQGKRPVLLRLLKEAGVETRPIVAGNFLKQPVIKLLNVVKPPEALPNADFLHYNGLFVGNDSRDLEFQLCILGRTLRKFVNQLESEK